jgi:sensor histidine kinase YesM
MMKQALQLSIKSMQKAIDSGVVLLHVVRVTFVATLLFGLAFGFLSGEFAGSLAISLTISITLSFLFVLDHHLLRPRLTRFPRDRQLILEVAFASLETVLGAALAFLVCVRIYRIDIPLTSVVFCIVLVFGMVLIMRSIRYASEFYHDLGKKELLAEQLRTLAAEAELTALRAQINPHFLFNTLNTIAQLVHTDAERAEETVERLAEMFRYSLNSSDQRSVLLGDELDFLDIYLDIEKVRFGDRLRISRDIAPETLDTLIPSLILQPLVENAIKHGRKADGSIDLVIRAHLSDETVEITVTDRGPGVPQHFRIDGSSGRGLRNVDGRLRKTYGDMWGLEITSGELGGTVVVVRIPVGRDE